MVHSKLVGDKKEMFLQHSHKPVAAPETEEILQMKVISYGRYEQEVMHEVREQDRVREDLPDYIWLLN